VQEESSRFFDFSFICFDVILNQYAMNGFTGEPSDFSIPAFNPIPFLQSTASWHSDLTPSNQQPDRTICFTWMHINNKDKMICGAI